MTMIVGMMVAMTLLLSMMVATMIVMTFVMVMKVAMTIQGSLTYDWWQWLTVMTVMIEVLVMMAAMTLVMAMMMHDGDDFNDCDDGGGDDSVFMEMTMVMGMITMMMMGMTLFINL